ncbi:MAG: alpha/beta hydrolase [Alphaproteobacteria bacterium]
MAHPILSLLLAITLSIVSSAAGALDGTYTEADLQSAHVPSPVPIGIYTPKNYDPSRDEPYPLLLQLHGGNGSRDALKRQAPALERAIARGLIPPVVSVMPSAGRSLYMDFRDGSERWETFVLEDLIPHMRATHHVARGREGMVVTGVSMGGMGALRLAFKHPDRFLAVAAMEPGIPPALTFDDVQLRDQFWRAPALLEKIYGSPVDRTTWKANNPASIAAADPERLVELAIYLEAGDQDMFYLHHGTEFLHRILFDAGLSHEYRLVRGADHVGPSLAPRYVDALAFLGRALDPPKWVNGPVKATRRVVDRLKKRAGLPVTDHDPRRLRVE